MLKKFGVTAALLVGLSAPLPLQAKSSWNYVGRITARSATAFTVLDKEHVSIALDERTTVVPWIREKPFVRKTVYLTPHALTFGTLVRVRTRDGSPVADVVEVARDVRTVFTGRVVAFDGSTLSVKDDADMGVVTLKAGAETAFREWFTVKPWVRPAVHLTPADVKVGALVKMYSSHADPLVSDRVEIAVSVTPPHSASSGLP
jgi:hypothetical protein